MNEHTRTLHLEMTNFEGPYEACLSAKNIIDLKDIAYDFELGQQEGWKIDFKAVEWPLLLESIQELQ